MTSKKLLFALLFLIGLMFADTLNLTNSTNSTNSTVDNITSTSNTIVITADQPLCKIYSLIKTLGSIIAVIMLAYAGFQLIYSTDMAGRSSAKNLLAGAIIGLVIIWLAPLLVKFLTGSSDVCGF